MTVDNYIDVSTVAKRRKQFHNRNELKQDCCDCLLLFGVKQR